MIERIYASLLLVAAGIAIANTLRSRKRPIAGAVFGLSIITIGIAAAVDYFQAFPTLLVYAFAAIAIAITVASVYLMFGRTPTAH